eukprot:354283-Chlamydomonas_euryale.AAC.6
MPRIACMRAWIDGAQARYGQYQTLRLEFNFWNTNPKVCTCLDVDMQHGEHGENLGPALGKGCLETWLGGRRRNHASSCTPRVARQDLVLSIS